MSNWHDQLASLARFTRVSPRDPRWGLPYDDSGTPGSESTNNALFLRMRDTLHAEGARSVIVDFGGGVWNYNNPNIFAGFRDLHLVSTAGGPATLVYKSSTVPGGSHRAMFANPGPFEAIDDGLKPDFSYIPGFRIKTVEAGSNTVALYDNDDAPNVTPGPYLLCSCNHQYNGYPPNLLYFQYVNVTSVDQDGPEYVCSLSEPTKHRYSEKHPDRTFTNSSSTIGVGAARLFKLEGRESDRAWNDMLRSFLAENVNFYSDDTSRWLGFPAYESVVFRHVRTNVDFYAIATERFVAEHVSCASVEVDKLITSCAWRHIKCSLTLSGATGVDQISLHDVVSRNIALRARHMHMALLSVGTFTNISGAPRGLITATGFANVQNARVHMPVRLGASRGLITAHEPHLQVVVKDIDGDAVYLEGLGDLDDNPSQGIDKRKPIFPLDVAWLVRTDGKVYGVAYDVEEVYDEAEEVYKYIYKVRWSGEALKSGSTTIQVDDEFDIVYQYRIKADDLTFAKDGDVSWVGCILDPYEGVQKFRGPAPGCDLFHGPIQVPLNIKSIKANVAVATVTDGTPSTVKIAFGPGTGQVYAVIDLTEVGEREITPSSSSGEVPDSEDDLSGYTHLSTHHRYLYIAQADMPENRSDWGDFEIIVECEKFAF